MSELDNLFGDVMNFMQNPEEFKNVPVAPDPFNKEQSAEPIVENEPPKKEEKDADGRSLRDHLISNLLHFIFPTVSERTSEGEMVDYLKRKFEEAKQQMEYYYRRGHNPNAAEIIRVLKELDLHQAAIFAAEEEQRSLSESVRRIAEGGEKLKKAKEEVKFWQIIKPVVEHADHETRL